MNRLLHMAVHELASRIRTKEISPVEVVDAHISRICEVNDLLNAVVANRFDEARREAVQAEARVLACRIPSELPPLLGIPCTVKEFFGVAGLPNSGGVVARKHVRATTDATVVRRIRQAGAVVIALTNVPEGGMWMETYNNLYGRTLNPWNPHRTPGGSSGGETAVIASGGSPFGLGSDIAGSIRIPSAFCGVVGHKPTGRMVPNTGHWPPLFGELDAYLCAGPIGRRVDDMMPLLRIIAGPDGESSVVRSFELGNPKSVRFSDVVAYPFETVGGVFVWPAMRRAVRRAADALEARGVRVERRYLPRIRNGFAVWTAMFMEAGERTYGEMLGMEQKLPVLRELLKLSIGRSPHTAPALVLVALESLAKRLPGSLGALVRAGQRLRKEIEDTLGDNGVLLYPPYSRSAPRHRAAMLTPFDFICTGIFNTLELPVTQVPVGFDAGGLPLGVQIAARRGNDHLTLAIAKTLEEAHGGWICADPNV